MKRWSWSSSARSENRVTYREGRPVVYLDQNKWIDLNRAIHNPSRLTHSERTAAEELIALVRAQKIIVVLSSGHLIETGRSGGAWRRQLAPLMVQLSRGWVMRDPLQVRHGELVRLLHRRAGLTFEPLPVVTLDPNAFFSHPAGAPTAGSPIPVVPGVDQAEESQELPLLLEAARDAMGVYAVLLEDVAEDSSAGMEAAAGWAQVNAALSAGSRLQRTTKEQLLAYTLTALLSDLQHDIVLAAKAARVTLETFRAWSVDAATELPDAPFLGRYRELMHERLRNPQERWEPNDLVDVLYLTCAAAYVDIVVGEAKTTHYLRRVQMGRSDGAIVCSSLATALEALHRK